MKLFNKIISVALATLCFSASAAAQNLLLNPGFESGNQSPWQTPPNIPPETYSMNVLDGSVSQISFLDPDQAPNFVVYQSPNDATGVPGHFASASYNFPSQKFDEGGPILQTFIAPCDGVYAYGGFFNRHDSAHFPVMDFNSSPGGGLKIYEGVGVGGTIVSSTDTNTTLTGSNGFPTQPEWVHGGQLVSLQQGQIYTFYAWIGGSQFFDEAYVRAVSGDCADTCCCNADDTSTHAWTDWLDFDNPGGNGDYETLDLHQTNNNVCTAPVDIECRVVSTSADASTTGQTVTCTPQQGFSCVNAQNTGVCLDYEVRFLCP